MADTLPTETRISETSFERIATISYDPKSFAENLRGTVSTTHGGRFPKFIEKEIQELRLEQSYENAPSA
ncbi:MAG: hypothetical protein OSB05_04500 [Akkermansiaceae bacterium]|nr:hypothetical protein [Akkermansiaceae bacterium]